MNTGRLHAALEDIKSDFADFKLLENIQQLLSFLQQSISTQTPETAKQFKDQFSKVSNILINSPTNNDPPTRQNIYKEIGAEPFIGADLLNNIIQIIENNQITPSVALAELTELNKKVTEFHGSVINMIKYMDFFNIEYDELDHDEYEVGISIPVDIFNSTLEGLKKEIGEIDNAFKFIKEILGEEISGTKIKTTSNTDWQVFFDVAPKVAACVAITIERIVSLYKTNLEIQNIKMQLEEKRLPKKVLKPLEEHLKESLSVELRKIADDFVEENYNSDDHGRKNELKTGMAKSLEYIANRIDNGCSFEVKASEPVKPAEPKEDNEEDVEKYKNALDEYNLKKELADKVNNQGRAVLLIKNSNTSIKCISESGS